MPEMASGEGPFLRPEPTPLNRHRKLWLFNGAPR
jgi:hypothetical protein